MSIAVHRRVNREEEWRRYAPVNSPAIGVGVSEASENVQEVFATKEIEVPLEHAKFDLPTFCGLQIGTLGPARGTNEVFTSRVYIGVTLALRVPQLVPSTLKASGHARIASAMVGQTAKYLRG